MTDGVAWWRKEKKSQWPRDDSGLCCGLVVHRYLQQGSHKEESRTL